MLAATVGERSAGYASDSDALMRRMAWAEALCAGTVLHPAPSVRLPARRPDVTYRLRLTGAIARYDGSINGQALDMSRPGAL